ncbi:MAG: ribonuclease III [Deltaproteobacteria bacterium]
MIEKKLGYTFKIQQLLKTSLAHSSFANETSIESYERLEFLGDAVLDCAVAKFLYDEFPEAPEGKLSKMRSAIVSGANFARFARELEIDRDIMLGKGEELTGGRDRESNLSGAFEAVIGAVYIDGGYRSAIRVINKLLKKCINDEALFSDPKTRLQELVQKKYKSVPKYRVVLEQGLAHSKTFYVEVKIGRKLLGKGAGRNKKEAEQSAAKEALAGFDSAEN